jgi:guanylate kinase
MIYVITGPSGCGKSTLIERALADMPNVHFSVSHTTREKRAGEEEGRDYYFVSPKKFERMAARREFVEWAVVHGAHYGTSKKEVLKKGAKGDLLLDIDVQGARQVKEKIKKALFIFILPPRFGELKKRLEARGLDSRAAVKTRLDRARQDIRSYAQFDFIVINDELGKAVGDLESIIRCQRLRLAARQEEIKPILASFRRPAERK